MCDEMRSQMLKKHSRNQHSRGFTLVEVLVATVILLIGVVSVAGVIGGTLGGTSRSGYMNQAATLATEKLEDLNRYPSADPDVAAGGSLTADSINSSIPYYDEIFFSPSQGAMSETVGTVVAGATQYQTISYTPDGLITTTAATAAGPSTAGQLAYKRRWIIEQDQPVVGVRRVTVLVTLENSTLKPPVTFQMSTVRP
jgi:prepilin-type N-terminal cleavage/methylation domain-containing protein